MALRPPLMASVQWNKWMDRGKIETGRDNTTWGGKGREGKRLEVETERGGVCGKRDGRMGNEGVGYTAWPVLSCNRCVI